MSARAIRVARLASALLAFAGQVNALDLKDAFIDKQDGYLDASDWLLEKKGFLPVPIIITEPAVGYGGGVGLTFFRESIGEAAEKAKETGHVTPPDVFAIAAFGTENGTKGIGGGGMFSFDDDRWRYRGGLARMNVNLDFYGRDGGAFSSTQEKIGYSLDGWASSQQVLRRLGGASSNDWIAARWIYLDLDSSFDLGDNAPAFSKTDLTNRASGLGLSYEHDSRDNIFTPSRGWMFGFDTLFYDPDWGSDTRFQTYRAHAYAYFPIASKWILGVRADGRTANGDVPFYQLPYLDMRGLPAARYQDQHTALAEAEVRWNVTPRWAFVGFAGAGRAWGKSQAFDDASTIVSRGLGFRYLIARQLGLQMGTDFAWGPDDFAFYIQVGSAWR
ncbi:MAG TPA: BamA/TamA family outer membrane protein [Burkholderiales bacterium]|nr:BamA/TamA family outer membrane protein [Burkholderiales bacterium]